MKNTTRALLFLSACVSLPLGGCGDGDRSGKLLVESTPSPEDEEERLRRLQMVRIVHPETGKVVEMGVESFASTLGAQFCSASNLGLPPRDLSISDSDTILSSCGYDEGDGGFSVPCAKLTRCLSSSECIADHLRRTADEEPNLKITYFDGNYYFARGQSTDARAALLHAAAYFDGLALRAASMIIHKDAHPSGTCSNPETPVMTNAFGGYHGPYDVTMLEYATAAFAENYHRGIDDLREAHATTLAAAERQRGSTIDPVTGGVRDQAGSSLSGAAAAHLVAGGKDGIAGSTTVPLCASKRLGPQEKVALETFRRVGISPAEVADTAISIQALVEGTTAHGSVKSRLSALEGLTFGGSVEDFLGISLADFASARRYLVQEVGAFARSQTRQLGVGALAKYVGTATQPAVPDVYWMALAHTEAAASPQLGGVAWAAQATGTTPFRLNVSRRATLAEFMQYARGRAVTFASLSSPSPELVAAAATVAEEDTSVGVLEHCSNTTVAPIPASATDVLTVHLFEDVPVSRLRLFAGEEALRCALTGTVEGAPCDAADLTAAMVGPLVQATATPLTGFKRRYATALTTATMHQKRLYLVVGSHDAAGPGEYTALAGYVPYRKTSAAPLVSERCRAIPFGPEIIELAARAMAPNPDHCTERRVPCAGAEFDERLPLEDELSDDGDGVESSWRHYLALAKQAASESDRLANEYLNSEVAVESVESAQQEKAIAALEELQTVCGTAVDVSLLLSKLQGLNGLQDLGPCSGSPSAGQKCLGGRLIRDRNAILTDDPELEKLATCIVATQASSTYHLGGSAANEKFAVCALRGSDGKLCGHASAVCPFVARVESADQNSNEQTEASNTCTREMAARRPGFDTSKLLALPPSRGLQLFDTLSTLPAPGGKGVCSAIRKLRAGEDEQLNWQSIQETPMFQSTRVSLDRERVQFAALPGGFAEIRVDGEVVLTTGNATSGMSSGWPCSGEPPVECPVGSTALFCQQIDCDNAAAVTAYTNRMFEAVVSMLATTTTEPRLTESRVPEEEGEETEAEPALPTFGPFTLPALIHRDLVVAGGSAKELDLYVVRDTNGVRSLSPQPASIATNHGALGHIFEERSGEVSIAPFFLWPGNSPEYPLGAEIWGARYRRALVKMLLGGVSGVWHDDFFGESSASLRSGVLEKLLKGGSWSPSDLEPGAFERFEPSVGIKPFVEDARFAQVLEERGTGGCPEEIPDFGEDLELLPFFSGCPNFDYDAVVENREIWLDSVGLAPRATVGPWGFQPGEVPAFGGAIEVELPVVGTVMVGLSNRPVGLDKMSVLDGFELLCVAASGEVGGGSGCGAPTGGVTSAADLESVGRALECQGESILAQAASTIFENFPDSAAEPISLGGDVAAQAGTLGDAYSELRLALLELSKSRPAIGSTVRQIGYDIRALHNRMARLQLQQQMNSVRFESGAAQNITNCLTASANAISITNWGGGAAAAATCANSILQTRFAERLLDLEQEGAELDIEGEVNEFNRRFDAASAALEQQEIQLNQAVASIARTMARIQSEQARGRRAANRALWYLSDEGSAVDGYRALRDLSKVRYERAHVNAQRLAFLAKRSVEQRLGVHLADLTDQLPLVDAPHTWEASICATSAIDYSALKGVSGGSGGANGFGSVGNFADAFIGDYVTKLENVVESYRLEYSFSEGKDTAVISLRDDVLRTRQECMAPGPNVLRHASALWRIGAASPDEGEWGTVGCVSNSVGAVEGCIRVEQADAQPFLSTVSSLGQIQGYDLTFAPTDCTTECGWTSSVVVGQAVQLDEGTYRFSWYGSGSEVGSPRVRGSDGSTVPVSSGPPIVGDASTWTRYYATFELTEADLVTVGFGRTTPGTIRIAAPMLEEANDIEDGTPGSYVDTGASTDVLLAVCQDADGEVFRSRWRRGCELLCSDGYAGTCAGRATKECFWETSFHVTQRAIERGEQLANVGFAKGNFNYRIERSAINLVGTGIRDCSDSSTPGTCYASGFVPYSLLHQGPFYVRNYVGDDFQAHLFEGNVEHARALAAERYVSNPVSNSDRDLIEQFMKTEFQGRPLDGTFAVRVWDDPSLNFNAIEDVQLILDYRYWTRNN